MARGTPLLIEKFDGGLNLSAAPYEVKYNEARDMLNAVGTDRGGVRKRDGSVDIHSSGTLTTDIDSFQWFDSNGVGVLSGNGKLQKLTAAGVVSDLKTGLTKGAPWEMIDFFAQDSQGPIFMMNGVDTPQQMDGLDATTSAWTAASGTLPNSNMMTVQGNRLWVAKGEDVFFSDIDDVTGPKPRTWPAENVVRFDPGHGGDITGIGRAGAYVIVFKADKAWLIYDLDTGGNRPLSVGVGCVSHRSIVETPRGTIFLARDGLYFVQDQGVKRFSDKVDPLLRNIDVDLIANAAGGYHDGHYYLSFGRVGSTDHDRTLDYDMDLESFWLHNGIDAVQWTVGDLGAGPVLMGAVATEVYRAFASGELEDRSDSFLGFWAGGFIHFGQPSYRKHLRQVHMDGFGYIELYVATDFVGTGVLVDTADLTAGEGDFGVDDGSLWGVTDGSTFGGGGQVQEVRAYTLGVGRAFSLKVGNSTDEPWELDSYTMNTTWRKD